MNGVEAEGIDFILRFRDAASDQIQIAEQGYRRLVSAMQEVIQTHRAFGNSVVETIANVAKQMSAKGGVPIVTPLTMNEGQLGLMDQFKIAAAGWFQSITTHFTRYNQRVQASVLTTNQLRGSVGGLITDFQGYGGTLKDLFPMLEQFTKMKFGGMQSDGFRRIMIDLRNLVKNFMDVVKISPEFQKAMKENTRSVGGLAGSTRSLSEATQRANFHGIDSENILERQRKKAGETQKSFDGLLKTMGNFSQLKWVAGMTGFGIATNQFIQKFSSLEDAAMDVKVRLGDMAGSVDDIVARFVKLGKQAGHSALETGSAFAMIAQKSGRINEATDALTVTTVNFAKLARVAPEYAGQIAGTLVGALKQTERQSEQLLKMAIKAQQGAKNNMAATDFLATMTDNVDLFTRAAMAAGQSVDVFVEKNAAGVMAMQKALSSVYGDATQATKMISALSSAITDDSKQMMAMSAWGQRNYFQMRELMKQGRMDEVYVTMINAAKRMFQESGGMINERIESFAQAVGMEAKDIRELSRMSTEDVRRFTAELKNTNSVAANFESLVKTRKGTLTGMMESISADWENIIAKGGMFAKAFVYPLIHGFSKLLNLATSIPGVTEAIVGLTMAFGALSTLGSIRFLMSSVGMGGWLSKLLTMGASATGLSSVFGRLSGVMTNTSGTAAMLGRNLQFGEVAATVASGGILARTWSWFKNIGVAARDAAMEVLNLNRAPKQLAFQFTDPLPDAAKSTSRLTGFLNNIKEKMSGLFRSTKPQQMTFEFAEGPMASGMRRIGNMLTGFRSMIGSFFTQHFPEIAEATGSLFSKSITWVEKLGSKAGWLGALLPKALGRFVPFAGWALTISDIVIWLDQFLKKLGPVGALLRVILAPFTLVAKVISWTASTLWEAAKAAWKGGESMSFLGKMLSPLIAPLKWVWNGMKLIWDVLKAITPDLNRLADQMTDINGLFMSWASWLDKMEEKFNGTWLGKAAQFFRGAPKEDPKQLQQARQQQAQAEVSMSNSAQMLYKKLAEQGIKVNMPSQGMSSEEWSQLALETARKEWRARDAAKAQAPATTQSVTPPAPQVQPAAAQSVAPPAPQPQPFAAPVIRITQAPAQEQPKPQVQPPQATPPVVAAPQVQPQQVVQPVTQAAVAPKVQPAQATAPQVQVVKVETTPQAAAPAVPQVTATPKQAEPVRVETPKAPNPDERPKTTAMAVPKLEPSSVRVSVNPSMDNLPEPNRPRLVPASFNANMERESSSRYLSREQAGDDLPSALAALQRLNRTSQERPNTGGDFDNSDVVRELQNIGNLIKGAISQLRETKRVPQEAPAFRPRYGQIAEGSA